MFRALLLAGALSTSLITATAMTTANAAEMSSPAKAGAIAVENGWSRATPPAAANGAAFMILHDLGSAGDTLLSASSPAAAKVELHTHIHDNGVMRMRPVENIPVPPGGTAELKPGGLHVMLMGLKAPLAEGAKLPVTLTFAKGGAVTVELPIGPAGATNAPAHKH